MSHDHDIAICRCCYASARQSGAPAVNIVDLGGGTFAAETADGKLIVESVSGCCKWAMKFEVAQKWLEKHGGSK